MVFARQVGKDSARVVAGGLHCRKSRVLFYAIAVYERTVNVTANVARQEVIENDLARGDELERFFDFVLFRYEFRGMEGQNSRRFDYDLAVRHIGV